MILKWFKYITNQEQVEQYFHKTVDSFDPHNSKNISLQQYVFWEMQQYFVSEGACFDNAAVIVERIPGCVKLKVIFKYRIDDNTWNPGVDVTKMYTPVEHISEEEELVNSLLK